MNKQKFGQEVLLAIYKNGGFGKNVDDVAEIVANRLDISFDKARNAIFTLKSKKGIYISNDIVQENKAVTEKLKKLNLLATKLNTVNNISLTPKTAYKDGDLVLGKIVKDKQGFYVVEPYKDKINKFIIAQTNGIEDSLNKTCLIRIDDIKKQIVSVVNVFGFSNDPISENIAIASKYGFSTEFPKEVIDEANRVSQVVTEEQKQGRVDYQNLDFVTIDPVGCKDKDDAIFDVMTDKGLRCYVAIADVSAVVDNGSNLDKEAFRRGNSAYLGGGVYPMFPPVLSNGICSLDENNPRLAVVASAIVNSDGSFSDEKIELAVINVKKSYSYAEAEKTHLCQDGEDVKNATTKQQLDLLYKNTLILQKRYKNILKIDSHEPEYRFSEDRTSVEDIKLSNEEYSHLVVETRMILANEIVAKFFKDRGIVGVFRTHKKSEDEKFETLKNSLHNFGIEYNLENTPESFYNLLELVKLNPSRDLLMVEIARSLSKAKYMATNNETAHFGLSINNSGGYIHFTSPIRRYADFKTHQLLKQILEYGNVLQENKQQLASICEHLNDQEKKSDMAESESDKYLACLWAKKHIGEKQSGFIFSIKNGCVTILHKNGTVKVLMLLFELPNAQNKPYKESKDKMSVFNGETKYSIGDKIDFYFGNIDLESRLIMGVVDKEKTNEENNNLEK